MQSRGGQETHKLPQKTNPAPPRTPLTHRVGADCKVREVRAGGPRPLPIDQDEPRLLGRVAAPRPSPSGAWRVRNHWPGSGVDSRIAVAVPQVDVWQAGVDASRLHIQGCDHPAVPTSGFTRK